MNRPPMTDADGEVRELTAEDMALFRPVAEVDPGMLDAMQHMKRTGGRPRAVAPRENVNLRLPPDLIAGIKATGKGYTGRIEDVLREALQTGKLDAAPSDLFDAGSQPPARR